MTEDEASSDRRTTDGSAPAPGTRRPGGRTARTRAAVRDAVLAGLTEHGYPGLTVEYVAEHSGVHKTTLYRRWKDLEGLVADALDLAGEDDWTPPDTGSLEGDLRALAREVVASFADPAVAASGSAMIAAGFRSERAAAALRGYYTERFARCEVLVERAVLRGELPAPQEAVAGLPARTRAHTAADTADTADTAVSGAIDAGALVRSVSAPLFFRLFITREPVEAAHADQAAAATLAAARAGAFTLDSAADSPHGTGAWTRRPSYRP
ncbi:TetR/AcrR family transcriptional regulator [Streptomyces sp. TM32]|uniref:TetR/AcrR family transcriptional regulator n=1 Tax=Streptomyces sp. TM32 TaxID=1652669 RepID=UPI0010131912|nr:TetR/AcrR family transcriptional regulator [Streptomyces sp. TM32]RXS65648.1 TetR/AcrR family transcriptional regulator [Streptomyces sp. TM32]